jgi:hypothetical protein
VPAHRSDDHFKDFCDDIFQALNRADQRRAGETYLHGLLHCHGRKSIRRMASMTPGTHSEQSLQQFINQSPWDYRPIRERLLNRLVRAVKPAAWVIGEVAFPKHGRYSAAVHRQYVRSQQKVSNCQLAAVAILASPEYSIPVNWRLVLPEPWGADSERRARARLPDHEKPRPYWQYQVETIDDMTLDWGMTPAPVVVDARQLTTVNLLLGALADRDLQHVVHVSGNLQVRFAPEQQRVAGGMPVLRPGARPMIWKGAVGDLVQKLPDTGRVTVSWPDAEGEHKHRSQFLTVPIMPVRPDNPARPPAHEPGYQLVVEWPFGKPQPRGYWITNVDDRPLADLVSLIKLPRLVDERVEEFAEKFGLRDYEGRTFAGWHHHVTLVSAAYIYSLLDTMGHTGF